MVHAMMPQITAMKLRADKKSTSAVRSNRRRQLRLAVRIPTQESMHTATNNKESIATKSLAMVPAPWRLRMSLNSPMTVRQTPTIPLETDIR